MTRSDVARLRVALDELESRLDIEWAASGSEDDYSAGKSQGVALAQEHVKATITAVIEQLEQAQ